MEIDHDCRAGSDVHEEAVVACVRRVGPDGTAGPEVRTFGALTADSPRMSDWLEGRGVRHVAMGSTGAYREPVFNLPGGTFEALPVDARRLKDLPGRETDVKDAEGIAHPLQYGPLAPGSIPPPGIRQPRELTRPRTRSIRDRAAVAQRIRKTLGDANIERGDGARAGPGASGRALSRALIAGEEDPRRGAGSPRRSGRRRGGSLSIIAPCRGRRGIGWRRRRA
jgi:hypothetical protein